MKKVPLSSPHSTNSNLNITFQATTRNIFRGWSNCYRKQILRTKCAEILTAKALYYSQQKKQYLKKALAIYEEAITLYPNYARINVPKQEKAYITRTCSNIEEFGKRSISEQQNKNTSRSSQC